MSQMYGSESREPRADSTEDISTREFVHRTYVITILTLLIFIADKNRSRKADLRRRAGNLSMQDESELRNDGGWDAPQSAHLFPAVSAADAAIPAGGQTCTARPFTYSAAAQAGGRGGRHMPNARQSANGITVTRDLCYIASRAGASSDKGR